MSLELNECPPGAPPLSQVTLRTRSWLNLVLVFASAIIIAAIASHLLAYWVKIKTTTAQPFVIGHSTKNEHAFLAGSSLASYGIAWDQISTQLDVAIRVWGIAGSSPVEWEQFQNKTPEAKTSFIVISPYDLDEGMICDFRAALVPLNKALRDLAQVNAEWTYTKRVLGQYPLTWLRTLFPTLGRSKGVMGDLRIKVGNMLSRSSKLSETEAGPTLNFNGSRTANTYEAQRVSNWSTSKALGKIAAMRSAFQSKSSFSGPKRLALGRMLKTATARGRCFVIVLPVSSTYSQEFLSSHTRQQFEEALAELQKISPDAQYLRLDKLPGSDSDDYFCDLVHINLFGKLHMTEATRSELMNLAK